MKLPTQGSSEQLDIPTQAFATQGNAILGIRGAGKSYTGTWLAEQLLDEDVPFVAFDPIGIWRNLKIGRDGGPGCRVVVAGVAADLDLTPESAPKIVRAAMKENVPLVLDLYSMHLSKADWKRIVKDSVELLLYENKSHGLRHIFIEEAAEFVPQRVGPDQGRVYSEIEKLARMGGNASLGYTLINQRAEEVNKAVLELCDCLFLHRQKGRHSLTALGKWLDVGDASNAKAIVKSLPTLPPGECWVWPQGEEKPVLVKIPEKKTFHPDRKNPNFVQRTIPADVATFVKAIKQRISAEVVEISVKPPKDPGRARGPLPAIEDSQKELELKDRLDEALESLGKATDRAERAEKAIRALKEALTPQYEALRPLFEEGPAPASAGASKTSWDPWLQKLSGGSKRMLEALIEHGPLNRNQLAFHAGLAAGRRGFYDGLSKLNVLRLVRKNGDRVELNPEFCQ